MVRDYKEAIKQQLMAGITAKMLENNDVVWDEDTYRDLLASQLLKKDYASILNDYLKIWGLKEEEFEAMLQQNVLESEKELSPEIREEINLYSFDEKVIYFASISSVTDLLKKGIVGNNAKDKKGSRRRKK